jgi:hypothetical protein
MSSLPAELGAAKQFHGHLGPYLALGLRLGKAIVAELSPRPYFGLEVAVTGPPSPPPRCVLDGLQLSTGCTFGKGNLTHAEGERVVVAATNKDTGQSVAFEASVAKMAEAAGVMREHGDEAGALVVWQAPADELFRIAGRRLRQAVPALVERLTGEDDEEVRATIVEALIRIGGHPVVSALKAKLRERNSPAATVAAATVLSALREGSATPALIELLNDGSVDTIKYRQAALDLLKSRAGNDFGYDVLGDSASNAKAVAKWQAWWEVQGRHQDADP